MAQIYARYNARGDDRRRKKRAASVKEHLKVMAYRIAQRHNEPIWKALDDGDDSDIVGTPE